MALDALSAYWIVSHTTEEKGLNVTLSSLGRSGLKSHVLQLTNHQVHRLEEMLQVNHSLTWVSGHLGFPRPGQKPSLSITPAESPRPLFLITLWEDLWLCDL